MFSVDPLAKSGTLGAATGVYQTPAATCHTAHRGVFVNVRPGLDDLRDYYRRSLHLVLPQSARAKHRAAFRSRVRAFIARYREQEAEEVRAGLPDLMRAIDANDHATDAIERAIAAMPYSPNVAAARIMIELRYVHEDGVDARGFLHSLLGLLRPHLSGMIAEDAAVKLEAQS